MTLQVPDCSSCAACANVCKNSAISMKLDDYGFYRPVIDNALCIHCGLCEKKCPWNINIANPNQATQNPETIAAYAKDNSIRIESSSGGIFTILAEKILDNGGVVFGVAQIEQTKYGHIFVTNKAELSKLRGSKYVQANAGLSYRLARDFLKQGRKVLFSGTPCQIAALYSVLKNDKIENLTTIDIVCHGTPSVKVFEKYIKEQEHEENSQIKECVFRNKKTGWRNYSFLLKFKNGFNKSIQHNDSQYMNLLLNRISQNSACSNCHYRKLPRIADITLGDYWNIAKVHPEMDDNNGTSLVLLNTKHGKELFNSIAADINQCKSKIDYAINGNPCLITSSAQHPKRAEFFSELDKNSLNELMKKFCPSPSIFTRVYFKAKNFAGCLLKKFKSIYREH